MQPTSSWLSWKMEKLFAAWIYASTYYPGEIGLYSEICSLPWTCLVGTDPPQNHLYLCKQCNTLLSQLLLKQNRPYFQDFGTRTPMIGNSNTQICTEHQKSVLSCYIIDGCPLVNQHSYLLLLGMSKVVLCTWRQFNLRRKSPKIT